MAQGSEDEMRKRIEKDISSFNSNIDGLGIPSGEKAKKMAELAKMYASDAKSYLDKGDLYTSFSCISYAHGILDAVKELAD